MFLVYFHFIFSINENVTCLLGELFDCSFESSSRCPHPRLSVLAVVCLTVCCLCCCLLFVLLFFVCVAVFCLCYCLLFLLLFVVCFTVCCLFYCLLFVLSLVDARCCRLFPLILCHSNSLSETVFLHPQIKIQ